MKAKRLRRRLTGNGRLRFESIGVELAQRQVHRIPASRPMHQMWCTAVEIRKTLPEIPSGIERQKGKAARLPNVLIKYKRINIKTSRIPPRSQPENPIIMAKA